ncbi:hypothetical protein N334_08917, partial [Pelecanus crispus]
VFQMLGCPDLSEELDRALEIFPTHLRSQCLGMPSLVLRGILELTRRPDTARKTLVLLPYVMEQLQDADSDAITTVLPVLSNMLQLLEGKMPSLAAPTSCSSTMMAAGPPPFLPQELDTVRELSIHLFQTVMGLMAGTDKKRMKEVVWGSLLPLLFHLYDED